ncbi:MULTISPECIES: molecular chaperone HtpG [Clostridium]|uniref:Chaperone protein HtpG n=3 Tax=Clostridium TaxID=1485 RepID=D8GIW4_CLOLD|nr:MULTISPECIES: molecular chaperone HtpG [Clostridium]ADK15039.1 heat shock protein htpG, chaperone, HSP90 family [Clostridium ljungdahlii DSM 13528]AGY74292.1 molecular chaperone HtpG [Clostridium autoethanogenum DSM 10061]ALU34483.1 Chaperone protein htpG [Clostridium autoethanogenum DSM 10061]OAA87700.1 Chaperone protein HtpG [Clostridium ljungdahlii DSM 13528]OVY51203.1 Chaperone protein HtpG [Clostridium autoethanogenum]
MATKQFKAESKRLLNLMINSIYTNKEIFLRELISNASDAIDKSYYRSLVDENVSFNKEDFYIRIAADKENKTLTITDTGIGMTKDELENNLGTIAKSGSFTFKNENEAKEGVDIIGQFGVGFYSAFMVSDLVTVKSRALNSDEAYKWESKGVEGYTIEPCEKNEVGTEITLKIKESTDDEKYDEFLDEYKIRSLIKKYSDFIKYPIKMMVKKSKLKEGSKDEHEDYFEDETLNSMVPIWRKNKNELKPEDYNQFYMDKHFGYEKPLKVIHSSVEGVVSYNTLLFIPARAPFDFYTKEFEKGLELYSNGVLIMEKCGDLLPDYFSFVQGLVDSADLSLNISRELLQHDRQLKFIAKKIKEKIKSELLLMQKNDREKYDEFYKNFGKQLKYGVYADFGSNKEVLQDLLMFYSSTEKKLVSLDEYVSRMKEDQKFIYYATGENIDKIEKLPQTEVVKDKGYEILYFTDEVDEFAIKMLMKYKEKEFKSVSSKDLGFESDDKESEKETKENKELFDFMKETLNGKVKEVRASNRLKTHPVCLANGGELSIDMEKVLNTMPNNQNVKADKILEINTNHKMFKSIKDAFENDKDKLKMLSNVLYNQALMIEGLPVDDPVEFANDVCSLIK